MLCSYVLRYTYDDAEAVQNALFQRKIEVPIKVLSENLYVRFFEALSTWILQIRRVVNVIKGTGAGYGGRVYCITKGV